MLGAQQLPVGSQLPGFNLEHFNKMAYEQGLAQLNNFRNNHLTGR